MDKQKNKSSARKKKAYWRLEKQWHKNDLEFAIFTNEIYKEWAGMTAKEYKKFKGLRKESLRDNMRNLEILLTDIGELTTRELAKKYKPYGLEENKIIAQTGGNVAKNTRKDIENKLGQPIINQNNSLV